MALRRKQSRTADSAQGAAARPAPGIMAHGANHGRLVDTRKSGNGFQRTLLLRRMARPDARRAARRRRLRFLRGARTDNRALPPQRGANLFSLAARPTRAATRYARSDGDRLRSGEARFGSANGSHQYQLVCLAVEIIEFRNQTLVPKLLAYLKF